MPETQPLEDLTGETGRTHARNMKSGESGAVCDVSNFAFAGTDGGVGELVSRYRWLRKNAPGKRTHAKTKLLGHQTRVWRAASAAGPWKAGLAYINGNRLFGFADVGARRVRSAAVVVTVRGRALPLAVLVFFLTACRIGAETSFLLAASRPLPFGGRNLI